MMPAPGATPPSASPVADEYDALRGTPRRRARNTVTKGEEVVVRGQSRQHLASYTRDLYRNLPLAAWAIRSHCNYVTEHSLQCKTDDKTFNSEFEAMVHEWCQAKNFDVAGRHNRQQYTRLMELVSLLDGDCGNLKLNSGHLQAIEGDLIRDPDRENRGPDESWNNGVLTSKANKAIAYSLWGYEDHQTKFQKKVAAHKLYLHGHYFRFNQVRGVSPLAGAINGLQDIIEVKDLAMAKMKVEQLFALVFFRDAENSLGNVDSSMALTDTDGDSDVDADDEEDASKYTVDFGKGPVALDLDAGDDAKFLNAGGTPSNTREFLELIIKLVLKALDIPMSFFSEDFTNYSGSRIAWLQYDQSCEPKRARVQDFLNDWLTWRLRVAIKAGEFQLPDGLTLERPFWHWQPRGLPWFDIKAEAQAEIELIKNNLLSYQMVCMSHGHNFEDIVKQNSDAKQLLDEYGLTQPVPVLTPSEPQQPGEEESGN